LDGPKQEQITAKLRTMAAEAHTDPTVQVERLTSFLIQAQRELGRRVQSNQAKAKPWWCCRTLDLVLRERNRARRWMILAKSQESFDCYRQWSDYFLSLVDSEATQLAAPFGRPSSGRPVPSPSFLVKFGGRQGSPSERLRRNTCTRQTQTS
jgi:hypothetical protein